MTEVRTNRRRNLLKGVAVAAGAMAAPMIAKGQTGPISMRWQSTWPSKDIFHEYALDFAKKVNDMTGGDLKIEVLPAGAVVPAFGLLEAVTKAARDGLSFGAPTEREIELAEEILKLVPSMDQVRLVSSGTEAAMTAIRLARGATGRSKFIKFEGCYHGHADPLLVKAGSGLATLGNPTSAGVPPEVVQHTLVLEYNNLQQLEEAFALHGKDLACLMIEPIAGNMNFVRASLPFVKRARELCTQYGALLVLSLIHI